MLTGQHLHAPFCTRLIVCVFIVGSLAGELANMSADELPSRSAAAQEAAAALHRSALEHFRASGDAVQARGEFQKVLSIDPTYAAALFNLGIFAERDQQWSAAGDFFDRAAKSAGDPAIADQARKRSARVRRISDLTGTAEGRKVLDYETALVHASDALDEKHPQSALAILMPLIQAQPDRWEALALIAVARAGDGDVIDAIRYLRTAGMHAPPDQMRRFDLAIGMLLGLDRESFRQLFPQIAEADRRARGTALSGIPEAEPFLLVRDVPGAMQVLVEIAEEDSERGAEAKRMLHELAPSSTLSAIRSAPTQQRMGLRFQSASLDGDIVKALLPEIVTSGMRLLAVAQPQLLAEPTPAPVAAHIEVPPPSPEPAARHAEPAASGAIAPPKRGLFVQIGSFPDTPHAEAMAAEVKSKGFAASVAVDGRNHRVLVGPIEKMASAHEIVQRLQHAGYADAFIRTSAIE